MPWQTWLASTDQAAMHRHSFSGAWEQKGDNCFGSLLLPLGASDADNTPLSTALCPEVYLPHSHETPKKRCFIFFAHEASSCDASPMHVLSQS